MAAFPLLAGAARADDQQGVASSRMSYSRFLEYLDMGRVKKVGTAAYSNTQTLASHSGLDQQLYMVKT